MSNSPQIYQVGDLVHEMRRLMEISYPEIWIEGELSSLSTPASGHLYFTLKDEKSQLRCAMFKSRANINRYKAKAGDLVRVRAKISVYTARGDLQCIVQHIEEAGEGILQRRFEELKTKLNNEGLFNASHKQPLPSFAKHIGIITSPSGAAVKDVLSTLKRRCPSIPVTIYPAVVQGETAATSLIEAIGSAIQHRQCDVLILTRGGGSLEDLWCFNDEVLANAIHQCPIPIVSGVGHEVDITIADLVADYRAPTPTAAAEILSPDTSHLQNQLRSLAFRLPNSVNRQIQKLSQNVDQAFRQVTHPRQQLLQKEQRLHSFSQQLNRAVQRLLIGTGNNLAQTQHRFCSQRPDKRIDQYKQRSQAIANRAILAQRQQIKNAQQNFITISKTLNAVSPLATLDRGFSIARNENNKILRDASQSSVDDVIRVSLKLGSLECTVKDINIGNE